MSRARAMCRVEPLNSGPNSRGRVPKRPLPARGGLRPAISQPADSSALLPDDHQMVAQAVPLIEGRDARVTSKECRR